MIEGQPTQIRAAMAPADIPFPQPTRRALQLSCALAVEALPDLNEDIERWGGATSYQSPDGDVVDLPYETSEFIAERYFGFGLPLAGACIASELDNVALPYMAARTTSHSLFTSRADFINEQLNRLLAVEHVLWVRARRPRVPYAFAYLGVLWLGAGGEVQLHQRVLPCLRCGKLTRPLRPTKAQPRCAACAKEPPDARRWPDAAIMPAERGTWWLDCAEPRCTQGPAGSSAFRGARHADYCEAHKTARLSKRQRLMRRASSPRAQP